MRTGPDALRHDCLTTSYPTQKQKSPATNGKRTPVKKKSCFSNITFRYDQAHAKPVAP